MKRSLKYVFLSTVREAVGMLSRLLHAYLIGGPYRSARWKRFRKKEYHRSLWGSCGWQPGVEAYVRPRVVGVHRLPLKARTPHAAMAVRIGVMNRGPPPRIQHANTGPGSNKTSSRSATLRNSRAMERCSVFTRAVPLVYIHLPSLVPP